MHLVSLKLVHVRHTLINEDAKGFVRRVGKQAGEGEDLHRVSRLVGPSQNTKLSIYEPSEPAASALRYVQNFAHIIKVIYVRSHLAVYLVESL